MFSVSGDWVPDFDVFNDSELAGEAIELILCFLNCSVLDILRFLTFWVVVCTFWFLLH